MIEIFYGILPFILANLNSIILLFGMLAFFFAFWRESVNEKSDLHWTDLLLDKKENRLSITKFGQFWGIFLSSWIAIYMAQKLTPEQISVMYPWVFGTWLTFLLASSGVKLWQKNQDLINKQEDQNKDPV